MSAPLPHIAVDSFAVALWLYGQGYRPVSAGINPATGRSQFLFPAEAQAAYKSYDEAKAALNLLSSGRTERSR
jgi:hypothetical protein